jgi:hypothetical protein
LPRMRRASRRQRWRAADHSQRPGSALEVSDFAAGPVT